MCERKMTFGGICAALAICVGLTGAYAADTVIGQIEVKNGTAGAAGAAGADGLSAYQIWLNNNHTGSEADFLASLVGATGPQGVAGKDGTSVKIKGTVSSCANLPNNADIGDIYMVTAQGNQGYIYDGTSWHCPETGINIQGPQGPQGPAGSACQSTLTTAACGPDLTQKCPVATKSGVIYTKTDCNNANPTQDVVYNGADGATGQDGTPGCATTLSKSKVGKVTTITAKDCNNTTLWTETVSDGNDGADGQDGAPGCADKVDISEKNAQGCYTFTKTPYSLVSGTCTAGTPVNKLVCDGAAGTNGTNCEPTFSSAHDATNKKTVVTISGCGSTSTVDIPDGQDGNDGMPGTNGVGICDNVANPATAVKTYTKTYTAPTSTTPGYVTLEQTMCNDNTNTTNYQDTCTPIHSTNKDICSGNGGTYMECTRQDTGAAYNICKAITTQNASAISTAIDAAQSAAETYTDNAVANKVTSSDVNSAISTALSDYDTSTQVSNKITAATSDKVTTGSLNTTLSSYLQTANLGTALKDTALKDDVASAVSASGALSGYLTSANAAETYANKDDVYNKTQVDSAISTATANKITATEVDNKITAATANLANKTYVDDELANKVTSSDVDSAISTALGDYSTTAQMNSALANKADTSALSSYLQTADLGTALKENSLKTDLASAVAGSGALTGYLTSADASSTYATQTALNTADGKITALESTVGDSNSGLVKQVATNTSTIGNAFSGLVKDVADAKTSAANAVSGLEAKLDKTVASSTYLSKTDATSTYLKKTDASSTYLTQNSAQSTYATKSALSTVETTANNAANDASSALTTAGEAKTTAQNAQNTANGHTSQIATLNTTVCGASSGTGLGASESTCSGGLVSSVSTLTSETNTLKTTVNGTCEGGNRAGCTQSLEARIRALEEAVF